jgi:hypothetical protein
LTNSQQNNSKYSAAFTAGALLYSEIKTVLPLLKQENFVNLLDQESKENNLLRIKTEAARTRVVTELKRRVRVVGTDFWFFIGDRPENEQKLALLYLVLKAYPLAYDFHSEVVLKKWKMLDYSIDRFDLQMRLDEIASQDKEVEAWSESTKTKLLTNYLRMLREAGLLGRTRLRKPENIDPSFWEYFVNEGAVWFLEACFLSKTERETYL